MEGKLQTSFIPKQPLVENRMKRTPKSIGLFLIIGWFIFIVVAAGSVGVFLYEQYLNSTIDSKNAELTNKVKNFDVSSVDHFLKLNARFQTTALILNNHLAVSALLDLISADTLQSVQFLDMKYSYDDGGKLSLNLNGKTKDFASAALQSDALSAKDYLQNQVFSNLRLDESGSVSFSFAASVDKSVLKYKVVN